MTKHVSTDESLSRYISLLTDFGFKRIFGEEANKDLLIDFLVLPRFCVESVVPVR